MKPTLVNVSPSVATVVKFPSVLTGIFGIGLVKREGQGKLQIEMGADQKELVLRPVAPNPNGFVTIVMDQKLYVLDIELSETPDIALTLETGAFHGAKPVIVSEKSVIQARPHFSLERLIDLSDRSGMAKLASSVVPDLYNGYCERDCKYVSEDSRIRTIVTKVQQFPEDDAIVLVGQVDNLSESAYDFPATKAMVAIGSFTRPITLLTCVRPIPPHASSAIKAFVVGDIDGSRANYSINNEYRLLVSDGSRATKEPVSGTSMINRPSPLLKP